MKQQKQNERKMTMNLTNVMNFSVPFGPDFAIAIRNDNHCFSLMSVITDSQTLQLQPPTLTGMIIACSGL